MTGEPAPRYPVHPDLLAGRYPLPEDVARMLDEGISLFIDLTEPGEREPYGHLLPPGAKRINLPIPDFSVPGAGRMREILNALDAAQAQGRKVYLHCWGGLGRTGTVIGCLLVRHGMEGSRALAAITQFRTAAGCDLRRESPETAEQRDMVLAWKTGL